jgi:AcrR family transcriptional regulator
VSPKTVEAAFGTKAALLQAAVDYAIRGDIHPVPIRRRPQIAEIREAPNAVTMLDLYAAHLRRVNERSARIAWAVEHAARTDAAVAELWARMNDNRRDGVHWPFARCSTSRAASTSSWKTPSTPSGWHSTGAPSACSQSRPA